MESKKRRNGNSSEEGEEGEIEDSVLETVQNQTIYKKEKKKRRTERMNYEVMDDKQEAPQYAGSSIARVSDNDDGSTANEESTPKQADFGSGSGEQATEAPMDIVEINDVRLTVSENSTPMHVDFECGNLKQVTQLPEETFENGSDTYSAANEESTRKQARFGYGSGERTTQAPMNVAECNGVGLTADESTLNHTDSESESGKRTSEANKNAVAVRDGDLTSSEESSQQQQDSEPGTERRAAADPLDAAVHLNIDTRAELRQFVKEIERDFVRVVNPKESGLLDKLISEDLLTDSDCDSLSNSHITTKEQARKLCLKIFSTMDVKDFKTKVFPELCRQFPHIIPSKFCSHKQERGRVMCEESSFCLRHDIMLRSRPSTMAEMLYHRGCLSLEAYNNFISDIKKLPNAELWTTLFGAFCGHEESVASKLKEEVRTMLLHYKLPVPPDLQHQLSRGVPCSCRLHPNELPPGASDQLLVEREASERDHISVSDNIHEPTLHFQYPGSQYLGSDDSEGFRVSVDLNFLTWAREMELSEETVSFLVKEGFETKQQLSGFTPEELEEFGAKLMHLPFAQSLRLKRAIKALQSSKASSQAIPGLSQWLSEDEKVSLLLVGKTGSGKSSTGNTILALQQEEKFTTSLTMASEVKQCQLKRSEDGKVEVVDCPGLFDTNSTVDEVCTLIVNGVSGMHPGHSAIVYTLKIGDRYTDEDFATYQKLKAILGKNVAHHMIVLFTWGDDLKRGGQTIENYIQSAPQSFQQVLRECENRYVVFDNTLEGLNREQIAELYKKLQLVDGGQRSHCELKHISEHEEETLRERHAGI